MKSKVLTIMEQAGQPMSAGDIAKISGLDKKIVDKAIKELKDEGRLVSPKRCFYSIKA